MDNTINAFWRLVEQQNVGKIITLCENIGIGGDCSQYFPLEGNYRFKEFNIVLKKTEMQSDYLVRRDFEIVPEEGLTKKVSHYHFAGWPDW